MNRPWILSLLGCATAAGCGPSPFEVLPEPLRFVEDHPDGFVFDSDAALEHGSAIEDLAELDGCWGRTFGVPADLVLVYRFTAGTRRYDWWAAQQGAFGDDRLLVSSAESGSFELAADGLVHLAPETAQWRSLLTGLLETAPVEDSTGRDLRVSLAGGELRVSVSPAAPDEDYVEGLRWFECP